MIVKDHGWSVEHLDKSAKAVIEFWGGGFDAHCKGTAKFPPEFIALSDNAHAYGKAIDSGVEPVIEQTRVAFAEALQAWIESASNNLTARDKALLEFRKMLERTNQ